MKILDRHVLREFLLHSAIGFVAFVGIFIIVDLFEKIDVFVDHRTRLAMILHYYLLGLPLVVVEVLPVSVLLGSILSLGQLKKWGELTAMQVTGVVPLRIIAPLLATGVFLSFASFVLGERVTPETTRRQEELYRTSIQGRRPAAAGSRSNLIFLGRHGRVYLAATYDGHRKMLRGVSVQHPRGGTQELAWRLDAESASWRDGLWTFHNGFFRRFLEDEELGSPFRRYTETRLLETPEDFARPEGDPLYMSRQELRQYIRRLREGGGRVRKYEVNYHIRGSFPFSNLVMILLGSVLAIRTRRGGNIALGVGLSLLLGFAYFGFIRVGQALGYHATLPPLLSAWLGNLTFTILGLLLLWRAHR